MQNVTLHFKQKFEMNILIIKQHTYGGLRHMYDCTAANNICMATYSICTVAYNICTVLTAYVRWLTT